LKLYHTLLKDIKEVKFFSQDMSCTTPWFIDTIVEKREELQLFLKGQNIGTRVMYPPINKQKAYDMDGEHKVSNMIGEKGLWFPSAGQLTNKEINYICEKVKVFYNEN
ncbi:MAG: aminotransferase, partial [Epsilonproteobacteria bacterium]